MNVVYISRTQNVDEVLEKWQRKLPESIKNRFARNKIYFGKNGENNECKVFFLDKTKPKFLECLAKNIKNTIRANECMNIVISDELKQNIVINNELQEFNIFDGNWLFNYLVYDIINYIFQKENKEISESEISVLVNTTSDTNIQNILKIAKNAKLLNIVTKNLAIFQQIEQKIFNDMGIMIRVTNNKKSLLKTDIIINLDFDEDELNKYIIPNKGILVNVNNKIRVNKKSFSGINISGYNVEIPEKYKKEGFNDLEMYESQIFCKTQFQNILKRIEADNIKIVSLEGANGIISETEYVAL